MTGTTIRFSLLVAVGCFVVGYGLGRLSVTRYQFFHPAESAVVYRCDRWTGEVAHLRPKRLPQR